MEYNFVLKKKLKNLSKNSPIFFKVYFNFKSDIITVKLNSNSVTYTFRIDRNKEPRDIIRQIYLTLFEKEYPRLESLDGNTFVIDKINLVHNLILLKKLNDPDSEEIFACKMKIPVVIFLRDYCSKELEISPIDRWNIYVSLIDSIYRGEDIYHK